MRTEYQSALTSIDSTAKGELRAAAIVELVPRSPASVKPDPLPLLIPLGFIGAMAAVLGAIAIPGLVSARVQELEGQNQAQRQKIEQIKQCVGGI